MIGRVVYNLVTRLALPFVLAYFAWRGRAEPGYRRHWHERLGYCDRISADGLWIHAASVGEVHLAVLLVEACRTRWPERGVLITTMTPTGRAEAERRLGDRVAIAYSPLDTPGATRRFMRRVRPVVGLFVETELWPNLIAAAADAGTKLALVNASVSARSATAYAQPVLAPAVRSMLSRFALIGAAEPVHAERFKALGAPADQVFVAGNLKYDQPWSPTVVDQARPLRADWQASERPVWVAASTHDPEEQYLLEVFSRLRIRYPSLLWLVVPRHPQRFDDVAQLLNESGWSYARRSRGDDITADTAIVLVDTLGELDLFYALADVAFVGGSLSQNIGGHNIVEAAAAGCPIVTGPDIDEWREPLEELRAMGGAVVANDMVCLTRTIDTWLSDPEQRRAIAIANRAAVERHRGALRRTLEHVEALLPNAQTI